jgi:hypothetical protein
VCIASYPSSGGSGDRRLPWAVALTSAGYVVAADYLDSTGTTFGRAPYKAVASNGVTGFPNNNDILLASLAAGGRCATWSAVDDAWWKHWKDHLFYGLSTGYQPTAAPTNFCITATCISVSPSPNDYAGVVLFAGRANAGQGRSTDAQRGAASNYLDNSENTNGDKNYVSTGAAPFNDLLYCINPVSSLTAPAAGAVPTSTPPPAPKFWVHPC